MLKLCFGLKTGHKHARIQFGSNPKASKAKLYVGSDASAAAVARAFGRAHVRARTIDTSEDALCTFGPHSVCAYTIIHTERLLGTRTQNANIS